MTTPARLTEDDRYTIAARAEAGARANRPTHLVAIGMLAVIVALTFTAFAWRADASAAKRLNSAASELTLIRDRSERLTALQAQLATATDEDVNRPIPDLLSRLENLAREAGLDSVPAVPRQVNEPTTDARRVNYIYTNVRSDSIERLVRWSTLTTERIPGMHVRRFAVRPQANAWALDITFARYERLD